MGRHTRTCGVEPTHHTCAERPAFGFASASSGVELEKGRALPGCPQQAQQVHGTGPGDVVDPPGRGAKGPHVGKGESG